MQRGGPVSAPIGGVAVAVEVDGRQTELTGGESCAPRSTSRRRRYLSLDRPASSAARPSRIGTLDRRRLIIRRSASYGARRGKSFGAQRSRALASSLGQGGAHASQRVLEDLGLRSAATRWDAHRPPCGDLLDPSGDLATMVRDMLGARPPHARVQFDEHFLVELA